MEAEALPGRWPAARCGEVVVAPCNQRRADATLWALLRTLLTTRDRLVCMACKALSSRAISSCPARGVARVRSPFATACETRTALSSGLTTVRLKSHGACNAQGTDHQHHHQADGGGLDQVAAFTSLLALAIRLIDQLRGLAVDALHRFVPCVRVVARRLEGVKALAVCDAHAFVGLDKLRDMVAPVPLGQLRQQLLRFGPDGAFLFSNEAQ